MDHLFLKRVERMAFVLSIFHGKSLSKKKNMRLRQMEKFRLNILKILDRMTKHSP